MIDLKKLKSMLDKALESETKESLEEFFKQINNKNGNNNNFDRKIEGCDEK